MKLKAILENLEGLPEEMHQFYVEKDGKYYLDLDQDIRLHPDVAALKNALDRQKTDNKTLKDKVTDLEARVATLPEDFDPEEYARLKAAADDDDDDDPKKKKKKDDELTRLHEQRITRMKTEHETAIAAKDAEIAEREATINRLVVDQSLEEALTAINVKPEFRKAVRSLLRDKVKVGEDDNGNPVAIVETDLNPELPIAKFAEDWAGSDEGQPFIGKPAGGGSQDHTKGKGKAGEKNPWSEEHWNLTEQGRILKTDRAKAERLAAAAGKRLSR